jgi:hypothetical protein
MRRSIVLLAVATFIASVATPATASHRHVLDGPAPAIWLSDPEGDIGNHGIEQFAPVDGSSGRAFVVNDRARIKVKATGLEPGHAYTMWIVFFNDQTLCIDGCNGADLGTGGGVIYGTGRVANRNGKATFRANLRTGDGAEYVGETPPPPFATAPFQAGSDNEFHIVIRSHGPLIRGEIWEQLTTFGGGCDVQVGPAPEEVGDFPVPLAPGECGDVQLYVFS